MTWPASTSYTRNCSSGLSRFWSERNLDGQQAVGMARCQGTGGYELESVATYPGMITVTSPSAKTGFSVRWHQSRACSAP